MSVAEFPKLDKRRAVSCRTGRTTFVYRLPVRLDFEVLPFIEHLGKLAFSFKRMRILRLECDGYVVTGIRKMKEIRASLDVGVQEDVLEPLEEALFCLMDHIRNKNGLC